MRSALVFAGTSFIGSALGSLLERRGVSFTSTDFGPHPSPAGSVRCDILERSRVEEVVEEAKPDAIFQCAGATQARDPDELFAVHVNGTLNVLQSVARVKPETPIVLFGSAAEYGPAPAEALPLTEDHPCRPPSLFGASKLAQTTLARAAARELGLRVAVARPFNVIGPGVPEHYLLGSLIERVHAREAETRDAELVVQNGSATRDFVDVRDVASAVVRLMERALATPRPFELFNIATSKEVSVLTLAQRLCDVAGGYLAVDGGDAESRSDTSRSCGDISRIRERVGWQPEIDWTQSVEDAWAWKKSGAR